MTKITISYRRADTGSVIGRIYDRLIGRYGTESVFVDIDDIPAGVDFRTHIQKVLRETDVLLAMVGTAWSGPRATGAARIHDVADPVRVEIASALQDNVTIVPVLVDGALMPDPADLPDDIREFTYRNAVALSSGKDFNVHIQRLVTAINGILGIEAPAEPAAETRGHIVWMLAVTYLLVPALILTAVQYLMVFWLDLSPIFLRAAAVLVPMAFGILLLTQARRGPATALLLGIGIGILVPTAMNTVVGLIDARPILPSSTFEWQETGEYFVTMALAMLGGNLIARVYDRITGRPRAV